jgi:putative ABC transport system permease protein
MTKLVQNGSFRNLDLYCYDDYNNLHMNIVNVEQGIFPPVRHQIAIERKSLPLTGLSLGDTLTVQLADGRQRDLQLTAIVHDLNAIPANVFPQLSGWVSKETLASLNLQTDYNRLEITASDRYSTTAALDALADQLRTKLENMGVAVQTVRVRLPTEHWGSQAMNSVAMILGGIGIFALFLSGFLVVNTVNALLAQQRRQIGMMKAVGGTSGQIVSIYLVTMAFYGVLALVVAIPVGAGLGYVFVASIADFLNFDINNFRISPLVIGVEVAVALLVPLVAALVPVIGGVRVTAREAMSTFASAKSGPGIIERALARLRGLPRPLLLSLRNTFRSKGRLALTLCTLVLAGVLFITVVTTRGGLLGEMDREMSMWNFEAELILDTSYPEEDIVRLAESVPGVTAAEGRSIATGQRIRPDGTKEASINMFGIAPDSQFVKPNMLEGRWLEDGDRNAMVLTTEVTRTAPDIKVGDEIEIESGGKRYKYQVVGIVVMSFDRSGFVPFKYLTPAFGQRGESSMLFIKTNPADPTSQVRMAEAVEKHFKDRGIGITQWFTYATIISSSAGQFDFLISFLLAMTAMAALIGVLGLSSALSLNVLERTREIGVMRSVGAGSGMIAGIVIVEGLLIGIISWVLAVPISIPFSQVFNGLVGNALFFRPIAFEFTWDGPVLWAIIVAVLSVVASLLPARRASSMSIRDTLAYE